MESTSSSFLSKLPAWLLIGLMFLAPLFIIPYSAAPFHTGKAALLGIVVCLSAGIFAINVLRRKQMVILKSPLAYAAFLIPLATLAAAFASSAPTLSLFGYGLDTDTVAFTTILALLTFVTAYIVERRSTAMAMYLGLLFSGWVVLAYEVVRIVSGGTLLGLNTFTSIPGNPIGSWNDLGIFFGLIATLALFSIVMLPLSKKHRAILLGTLALVLLGLVLVNFTLVWFLLSGIAVVATIYGLRSNGKKTLLVPVAVGIISVFFAFGGFGIPNALNNALGTSQIEARPSFESTYTIAKEVYAENALFGVGPNLFRIAWDAHHPTGINATPFWNTDFNAGFGIVPTAFITAGILGGLAWILLLLVFLVTGIRTLAFPTFPDEYARYLSVSSFMTAVFILALAIFYVPGPTILGLGFIFVGLFVASRRYSREPIAPTSTNMITTVIVGVITVILAGGAFFAGSAYASATWLNLASASAERGATDAALRYASYTQGSAAEDRALRLVAAIHSEQIRTLIETVQAPTEEEQESFRTSLAAAINAGISATHVNQNDYRNWIVLAEVYSTIVPIGIEGAYENALKAYAEADRHAPRNPQIPFNKARMEIGHGDLDEARTSLNEAIARKNDYTPALYLLSQLEATVGNIAEALKRAEAAAAAEPNNEVVLFQLGALLLGQGDYASAKEIMERAVAISPGYANAQFLLGQSLVYLGEYDTARAHFEIVAELNPDNTEVQDIISALREGRDPFTESNPEDTVPPDDQIE